MVEGTFDRFCEQLLRAWAQPDAFEQQRNQFALPANARFREDVSQMHAGSRAPDPHRATTIFQREAIHQVIGETRLGAGKSVELSQFRFCGFHR